MKQTTMFQYLLTVPLLLVLYLVYHLLIKIYVAAWRFKKMDPTLKVYIAPFFGLQGVQKQNVEKYGDSQRFMRDMVRQNPDQKALLSNLGSKPFLILCDPQLVKEFLLNPKRYKKFNLYKHSRLSYDQGIFLVQDEDWSNIRTIIRHSFTHQQLKGMIPTMQRSIKTNFTALRQRIEQSESKSVDFKVVHDTEILIGEILVKIFFSEQGAKKKVDNTPLSIALAQSTTLMFYRSRSGANILFSLFFGEKVKDINFSKSDKELQEILGEIRLKIQQILDKRIALQDDPEKDFIQHYVSEMKKNDALIAQAEAKGQTHKYIKITKEHILHQLFSFYFAGIDTTGHLLAFALYALAEYPQHKQTIIDEIKENVKGLGGITYQNLSRLEFTSNFLDQCLRMWPPATGTLVRSVRQDTKLGPYDLEAGTLISVNMVGIMNNPKYYQNPQIFNPNRWTVKGAQATQAYSFVPFSAGPRSCIGKYLALMQTKLILIYMLNEFDISRTQVPLRLHAKFLYQPIQEDLISLKIGGMGLQ